MSQNFKSVARAMKEKVEKAFEEFNTNLNNIIKFMTSMQKNGKRC